MKDWDFNYSGDDLDQKAGEFVNELLSTKTNKEEKLLTERANSMFEKYVLNSLEFRGEVITRTAHKVVWAFCVCDLFMVLAKPKKGCFQCRYKGTSEKILTDNTHGNLYKEVPCKRCMYNVNDDTNYRDHFRWKAD